ncbi:MAG: hypothetical protein AB8B91_08240, partial [Rubripirellula sp.]
SSGSVIAESKKRTAPAGSESRGAGPMTAGLLSVVAFAAAAALLGIDFVSKPGGLVLAFILCLALTTWGARLLSQADRWSITTAVCGIAALSLAYLASYSAIYYLVSPSAAKVEFSGAMQFVMLDVALAFIALFALHAALRQRKGPAWLEPLRIHASSGFYIDSIYRRLFGGLLKS